MFLGITGEKWLLAIVPIIVALITLFGVMYQVKRKKNDASSSNKGKIVNKGNNNQSSIGNGNTFSSGNNKEKDNG